MASTLLWRKQRRIQRSDASPHYCRTKIHPAIITPTAGTSVVRALLSGVSPSLTLEKITLGSVPVPAPEVKLAITRWRTSWRR